MRMWMVDTKKLCKNHLLGEHFEIHCAVGNLKSDGLWAKSLTDKGFLEPQNFIKRHEELVIEMTNRGMKHNSPIEIKGLDLPYGKVDVKKSIIDLKERCVNCEV